MMGRGGESCKEHDSVSGGHSSSQTSRQSDYALPSYPSLYVLASTQLGCQGRAATRPSVCGGQLLPALFYVIATFVRFRPSDQRSRRETVRRF